MVVKGLTISDGCLAEEKAQGPGARSDGCHTNFKPLLSEQGESQPQAHKAGKQADRNRNPQAPREVKQQGPQPCQLRARELSPSGNHPCWTPPLACISCAWPAPTRRQATGLTSRAGDDGDEGSLGPLTSEGGPASGGIPGWVKCLVGCIHRRGRLLQK